MYADSEYQTMLNWSCSTSNFGDNLEEAAKSNAAAIIEVPCKQILQVAHVILRTYRIQSKGSVWVPSSSLTQLLNITGIGCEATKFGDFHQYAADLDWNTHQHLCYSVETCFMYCRCSNEGNGNHHHHHQHHNHHHHHHHHHRHHHAAYPISGPIKLRMISHHLPANSLGIPSLESNILWKIAHVP